MQPQKSWKKRLSGIFQKNKKDEIEETPKREQPPPKPAKDTVAVEVSVKHSEQPMDEGTVQSEKGTSPTHFLTNQPLPLSTYRSYYPHNQAN